MYISMRDLKKYIYIYILGMGVRNQLLEYSSLQMNSVGGQANSSLHIHTQTKFSEANVYIFCRRHKRMPWARVAPSVPCAGTPEFKKLRDGG